MSPRRMIRFALVVAAAAFVLPAAIDFATRKAFKVPASDGAVLISGASSGIGRAAAVALAEEGFLVFAGVRKSSDADSIAAEGISSLKPIILDVTDAEQIEIAKTTIVEELRRRDVEFVCLVNNAGIGKELPIEVQSLENIRRVFDVNVFGLVALTKAFVPLLRESEGRVINIGSVAGKIVAPMKGTYAATKHALEAINDALRLELAHWGMSVSLVQPAYVKTQIAAKQTGENAQFKKLPRRDRELYSHIFDTFEAKRLRAESLADSPDVTTTAIRHALTSPYPKTRYAVANVNGVPAKYILWLASLLPDRVLDVMKGG